jgi:Ni2+-binding GTPase involved in maturation of urease and hydrogenase
MSKKITRVGIGGPVGSGKTAIVEAITPRLLDFGIKVLIITNDVVTTEDASSALSRASYCRNASSAWRRVPALIRRCAKIRA